MTALTSEVNDIATNTILNCVKLLDGTNSSINFQLGANAVDQLTVALESSKATDLGLKASMGSNIFSSSRIELAAGNTIAVDAIKINGQNWTATKFTTTAISIDGSTVNLGGIATLAAEELQATAIAQKLNENSGRHSVTATAINELESHTANDGGCALTIHGTGI